MNIRERMIEIRAHLDAIERELKPDGSGLPWHEAPTWAMWAAMDMDGTWVWYDLEPSMEGNEWLYAGRECKMFEARKHPDWTKSKQRRPQ